MRLFGELPSNEGLYSSTCLIHCLSSNADWYQFTTDGVSLAHAVGQWFFQDQDVHTVSTCQGWDCTLQCSGGPWEPTNPPCPTTTNICANTYMNSPTHSSPEHEQFATNMTTSSTPLAAAPVQSAAVGAVTASEAALSQKQQALLLSLSAQQ